MFNDEDVKKSAAQGVLYVICFVCIIGALVIGLMVSIMEVDSEEAEVMREEVAPTVEFEKNDNSNNFTVSATEVEANTECEHNWVFSEEESTLIWSTSLESVASEGIEVVYLTRYREAFDKPSGDIYIAYDEYLNDITLYSWNGLVDIEYFPAGKGMGTPRLEEYEFTLYVCENCNHLKHVDGTTQTMYKFYIPEGTYLITH